MPISGGISNNSAILAAIVPRMSYADIARQRDRELQYSALMAERERQNQQQQLAELQTVQKGIEALRSQPFEEPDKRRVRQWVKGRQNELAQRIEKEYAGDVKKWVDTEARFWTQQMTSDFLNSDIYTLANRNKEAVAAFRKAVSDGENVIGSFSNGSYKRAEQELQDFYQGASPGFQFRGSYKPSSKITEHFSKIDNPGGSKFDQNAVVSEAEKLNYLISEKGNAAGRDQYMRDYMGTPIRYKTYSMNDQVEYLNKIRNTESQIAARGIAAQQRERSLAIQQQNADTSAARARAAGEDGTLPDRIEQVFSNPIQPSTMIPFTGGDATIGGLNIPASQLSLNGQIGFSQYSDASIGDKVDKIAGIKKGLGRLTQVVVPDVGGKVLDLSNVKHTVTSIVPGFWVDDAANLEKTQRDSGIPSRAFRRVKISIPPDEAEKAGLYQQGWFVRDGLTEAAEALGGKAGAAIIDKKKGTTEPRVTFEVMVPISDRILGLPELRDALNKSYGQKSANEIAAERAAAMGATVWSSPADNIIDDDE